MDRNLIIDVNLKETVIALLEDHRLVELNKEQNTERAFSLRDVYLGKVKKLIPTLNAAFVDIGDKKDAFVHYLDLGLNFKAFDYFAKQINPNRDFKTFFSGKRGKDRECPETRAADNSPDSQGAYFDQGVETYR